MLTATVFVDFGEGFIDPDGAGPLTKFFETTPATLSADITSGGLQGPNLVSASAGISSSTPIVMTTLEETIVDFLALDYNGDSTVDSNDYLDLKADILDYISQVYEPFNIDVVEAANGTAAGVQSSLTANNGLSSGKNDTYLFVTPTFFHNGSTFLNVGTALGALGIASATDIVAEANTRDDSAIVFVESILDVPGLTVGTLDDALGRVASHEAGHGLGLEHITTSTTNNYLLGRSDTISSPSNVTELTRQTIVSRVPLATDSGSPTTYVPADRLGNDPDIGYKSGIQYITGTGSKDVFTISRQSETSFSVHVRTYDESSNEILVYSYTISGDMDDIRIYGAAGDDAVSINAMPSAGYTQVATFSVWGMEGSDSISFNAGGTYVQNLDLSVSAANVQIYYAPDSATEVDSAIERFSMYNFGVAGSFDFHNLTASTTFSMPGSSTAQDRIRIYARNGIATGFIQDEADPGIRIMESSSLLPGAIRYTPGSSGINFIDFYGSTANDFVELYDFSEAITFEFFGGAGFDQVFFNDDSASGTRYQVNDYTSYSMVTVSQELYPDFLPGVWMPLQGKFKFNDSVDSVDRLYFVGGTGDDSVTLSELMLATQVIFSGNSGNDTMNIDLDGQTVYSSNSYYVRYTDGTNLYAPIYYFSATLNTY